MNHLQNRKCCSLVLTGTVWDVETCSSLSLPQFSPGN